MRRHALRAALPPVLGLASVGVALMVTMFLADLVRARIDPRAGTRT